VFLAHATSIRAAVQRQVEGAQRFGKGCAFTLNRVRLLIAEDDEAIIEPLTRALTREGYDVETVGDGLEAARRGIEEDHDLLVLDIGIPRIDGLEVCRRVRAVRPRVPIMILTAQGTELDVVVGLDAGADDYVAKPFRLSELLARIRSLLRRAAPSELSARSVRVDADSRRAWLEDRELELTPKEFDLLALLVSEAGRVITRDRIMAAVWDANWFGSTKTLDMHVSGLRRKLGDDANAPRLLTTVRGVGFRFEA
jgi:DNA-binding response OmpR family regulator